MADLRREIGNSIVAFEPWVLRPFCWGCARNMYGMEDDDIGREPNVIPVLPSTSEYILCLYDRANQETTFIIDEENQSPYELGCWLCGQDLEIHDGATIPIYIDSFSEYFQVPEGGMADPPASFKRRLKTVYGNSCVNCRNEFEDEDLTVDHIVARVHGGDSSPLNLQVLCRACNEKKADAPAQTLELYLDFDLQPLPE